MSKKDKKVNDEEDFFGPSKVTPFSSTLKERSKRRGRRPNPDRKPSVLVGFKVSPEDYDIILKKAKAFDGGNISAWARRATKHYLPKATELVKPKS